MFLSAFSFYNYSVKFTDRNINILNHISSFPCILKNHNFAFEEGISWIELFLDEKLNRFNIRCNK